jgi:N-acetylneuraminic acid mutarotase
MVTDRTFHTATLLPDGRVLVTGGAGGGPGEALASAELYDPSRGTWTATGSMGGAREEHTATLLPNGKVLVTGGSKSFAANGSFDPLASAELYNPSTGSWSATKTMLTRHWSQNATLLPDGTVLAAGGGIPGTSSLAYAELYDPGSGT